MSDNGWALFGHGVDGERIAFSAAPYDQNNIPAGYKRHLVPLPELYKPEKMSHVLVLEGPQDDAVSPVYIGGVVLRGPFVITGHHDGKDCPLHCVACVIALIDYISYHQEMWSDAASGATHAAPASIQ